MILTLTLTGCTLFNINHRAFKSHREKSNKNIFIFDPRHLSWGAYNKAGKLVKTGVASGGGNYCPDIKRQCRTIVGTFKVIAKGTEKCYSRKFPLSTGGGAPMPYCMLFHTKGYAIHGSNSIPNYNASHGCIRITPKDAKWLNHHFINIGSKVIVRPY